MATSSADQPAILALIFHARRPVIWPWLAAPFLVLTLIGYCQLHSIVLQVPATGLAISVPWALQTAFGWIVVSAALVQWGPRVAQTEWVRRQPWPTMFVATVAVTLLTLLCDVFVTGQGTRAATFLYARTPVHLLFSALLVGGYAWRLARTDGQAQEKEPGVPGETVFAIPHALLEVMTGTGQTSIRIADIECLRADRNYVSVVHASGRTYLLRQTLTSLEATLDAGQFVRVHRSTIVNRERIRERRSGNVLVLKSGLAVNVGRAFSARLSRPISSDS